MARPGTSLRISRRGARADEWNGLENRREARPSRGFESHPLRKVPGQTLFSDLQTETWSSARIAENDRDHSCTTAGGPVAERATSSSRKWNGVKPPGPFRLRGSVCERAADVAIGDQWNSRRVIMSIPLLGGHLI